MNARENVQGMELIGNLLERQHPDVLRQILLDALQHVMDAEVATICQASYGQRSDERQNSRNGYRSRPFDTRLGSLDLQIPKLRKGSYLPSFIEPRRRWEQAFVQVVTEAYVLGVSTRKIDQLVEAMGAKGISKSEVSRMASSLDQHVQAFKTRPLESEKYPYLWLDAVYLKVRQGLRIVSMAVLVAIGVDDQGQRQLVGVEVADGEMELAWRHFMEGLVRRGLKGVRLVISDAHSGLNEARRQVFNGVAWQRCRVHFMRNVLCRVPKQAKDFVAAAVKQIFAQMSYEAACVALGQAVGLLATKYPAAAKVLDEGCLDALTYMTFPQRHWRQLHSTNVLERLNREIKRRTDVVGIFPNASSALRLVAALLMEQDEEWSVGRRYFSKDSMLLIDQHPPQTLSLAHVA